MLSGRAVGAVVLAAMVLVPLLGGTDAEADHAKPGGTGTPAVEEVAGAVTKYRHFNPWVCTNPQETLPPPSLPVCSWPDRVYRPLNGVHETSCELVVPEGLVIENVEVGETIGTVVNGRCGHSASDAGNDHWSFGGNSHSRHRNVVLSRESRWRCTLAGSDETLRYDSDGHAAGHAGAWCGTWVPTEPTVNISGTTVVEGSRAALTVLATSGFDGGAGSVSFETVAGSASAGSDFQMVSGAVSFDDAGLSRPVIVQTVADDVVEGSETFTVRLFGASGVVIGSGTATVTISDDDSASCPPGQTGVPPNCVPVVVSTGCDVAGARLASLSVTGGGSELLGGFAATTYAYTVRAESVSVLVAAAAAGPSATVRIGRGVAHVGSASHESFVSEGSAVSVDVVVSAGSNSCTYSLSIERPAEDVDCGAFTGLIEVDGVCVEACTGNLLPIFDAEGGVDGCQDVGDCPYDLIGFDPDRLANYRIRDFDPVWLDGPAETAAVAVGGSVTVTRTAVKCATYWRSFPSALSHYCVWNETNLAPAGDCLLLSLEVEAVIPSVEAGPSSTWSFMARSCGTNRTAPTAATWTADDATCSSADGQWSRAHGSAVQPTGVDPGEWTVTLLDDQLSSPGSATGPYVDVPLQVNVTDWGDASHLRVRVNVTSRGINFNTNPYSPIWWDYGDQAVTYLRVPRRSGPPPADDMVQVNIADLADNGSVSTLYVNGRYTGRRQLDLRYAQLLRTELLSNDACPIGADCADPHQWPVEIVGDAARRCTPGGTGYSGRSPMLATAQGVVGCDDLNEHRTTPNPNDPPSVWYWPRMWAAGEDSFRYRTYGGEATVTVRFTDTPPAADDITVHDPGTEHTVATFDSPVRGGRWCPPAHSYGGHGCRVAWTYYARYPNRQDADWSTLHHAGFVALAGVRDSDPDGDASTAFIADGHNPHLTGQSGVVAESNRYSQWVTDETEPWERSFCYLNCLSVSQSFADMFRNNNNSPINPADGSATSGLTRCVAHTGTTTTREVSPNQWSSRIFPRTSASWSAPTATDPDCRPSSPDECSESTMLVDWSLCYALWPNSTSPDPLVVHYRACDARRDAARSDSTAFGAYLVPLVAPSIAASRPHLSASQVAHLIRHRAAGNTSRPGYPYSYAAADWEVVVAVVDPQLHGRYCSDGTITVLLGGCTWNPTAAERALLAGSVQWHSFIELGPTGEPGEPWPPHPELPGGHDHLVITNSPVWPRVNAAADLDVTDADGCVWSADWLRATVTQMLPWVPAHRSAVEAHGGHGGWLGVWDRLSVDQQAEAQALHTDGDLTSVQCPIAAAADPTEPSNTNASFAQCRWELGGPGVWHWTLDAAFSTVGGQTVTEILAEEITWFRSFDAYTKQQTFASTGSSLEG